MTVPATLRVLFARTMVPSPVFTLHCTTVPFSSAVALNVRVEVISARVVLITVVELEVLVRVTTKLKSTHCTAATSDSVQFTLLPVEVLLRNRTVSFPEMNGSTTHSSTVPWLTVQV